MLCTWCGKAEATEIVRHLLYEPKAAIGVCASCRKMLEEEERSGTPNSGEK